MIALSYREENKVSLNSLLSQKGSLISSVASVSSINNDSFTSDNYFQFSIFPYRSSEFFRLKKIFSIAILFVSSITCSFSQNKFGKGELTISLPFVWNKFEVTNLIGSGMFTPKNPNGQGWSGGLNATYQWYIFNGFFLSGGLGFYQQNFFIHR